MIFYNQLKPLLPLHFFFVNIIACPQIISYRGEARVLSYFNV